jgi:phosphoribosylanthranilate isomerase
MMVRVKVCGITSFEDAVLSLDLGADALGFNFCPSSPRHIDPGAAHEIVRRLPPFAVIVGVFVNVADPAEVDEKARAAGVQIVQLHGDESPDYCRQLGKWPLIKALRIDTKWFQENLDDYPVRAFLLDSRDESCYGGTGKTFDWTVTGDRARHLRIILAGGLNPENVAEAIRTVRPYGVDVCSGIELRPGKNDPARLAAFMNEVRNVPRQFHS